MATRKDRRRDRTPLEESYGESSSVPFPGDTLPWNLSKHQRVKRSKSASGEVLDPAERAVIRIAALTFMPAPFHAEPGKEC
ncbi:microtubule-actin cross-linking factor 1-like [Thunnus thynnus]|uniref:microtubule-actin cross-linking factor 1-like n=1 Tax=Thunnus thynnus TaxID=8237 RepID=UPI0035298FDD